MTNILRRLFNAVESLGGNTNRIQYILASATVGNSTEMALKLIRQDSYLLEHTCLIQYLAEKVTSSDCIGSKRAAHQQVIVPSFVWLLKHHLR